jgi:signal transduction histidine kinase
MLAAALLTAPIVLVIERLTHRPLHPIAVAIGATLLSVLVLRRLGGLVTALDRLRIEERAARSEAETTQRLLAEQNERLREADRLKDEFVALISHDLRTPLTSIIGYVELTLDQDGLNDEQRTYLEIVARNSERLLHLVNDLLFVARLEAGELELKPNELDLAAIARQSVDEAQPRAEAKGIDLSCEIEPVGVIRADRGRMFQLLDNLLSNAIKFTPEGGRVAVQVTEREPGVRLTVSDSGIGIPEGDRKRLFDRFFRAASAVDRQIPGTGLGLYIARAIVEAHGGTISLDGTPASGSTFMVELPFARAVAETKLELVT